MTFISCHGHCSWKHKALRTVFWHFTGSIFIRCPPPEQVENCHGCPLVLLDFSSMCAHSYLFPPSQVAYCGDKLRILFVPSFQFSSAMHAELMPSFQFSSAMHAELMPSSLFLDTRPLLVGTVELHSLSQRTPRALDLLISSPQLSLRTIPAHSPTGAFRLFRLVVCAWMGFSW